MVNLQGVIDIDRCVQPRPLCVAREIKIAFVLILKSLFICPLWTAKMTDSGTTLKGRPEREN